MFPFRKISGLAILASLSVLATSIPSVADRDDHHDDYHGDHHDDHHDDHWVHLDLWDTRRIVRHLEEKNDLLQDRIIDWVSQRRDEREHRAEEMLRAAEHFDQNLAQFKIDLYHHEDPWELRENARNILDVASDLGHIIDRGEWHDEIHREWEDTRDSANDLARQFHLPEID